MDFLSPELLAFGRQFFLKIFFILNPLIIAPLFMAIAGKYAPDQQKKIAFKACLFSVMFLWGVALCGKYLLGTLISNQDLMVAGGILLFVVGFSMASGSSDKKKDDESEADEESWESLSIVPIGFPLIVGPAAITLIMTSLAEAPQGDSFLIHGIVMGIVLVMCALLYISFLFSPIISKVLGKSGILITQRVAGLLITAISVQMVGKGIKELMAPSAPPIVETSIANEESAGS
jgi:multiple antibiotic resistance protein